MIDHDIRVGDLVSVGPNDADVPAGVQGQVVAINADSGFPVVRWYDPAGVNRRARRNALWPQQLTVIERGAVAEPAPELAAAARSPRRRDQKDGAVTAEDFTWDIFDPSESFISITATSLRLSPKAARHFRRNHVELLVDRANGAIGIHLVADDSPVAVQLYPATGRGGAAAKTVRERAFLDLVAGNKGRHNATWDAAAETLIVTGLVIARPG